MEVDVSWKEFFHDDAQYADVINALGCGGRQVVSSTDLQEVDSQILLNRTQKRQGTESDKRRKGKHSHKAKMRDR